MKKFLFFVLSVFSVLSLCGCYINLTSMTKINDDGSGFRITTYTADGASDKEELLNNYIFPQGGAWKLENYAKDAVVQYVYEVKRAFSDINKLKSDYIRKGHNPANISDNRYYLKINRGLIYTTYEYEEVFKDCTDAKKIKDCCERLYDRLLDISAAEIEKAFPQIVEKQKVKALLDEQYRPYYDYLLPAFLKDGWKIFDDQHAACQQKTKEFEEKYDVESFSEFLTYYIISLDEGADREAVLEKSKAVHEKIDEQIRDNSSLNDINCEDAFGVYGWPLFMGHSFNISVVLPGRIIEANTKDIKGNVAKWEFSNDDFLLNEYSLKAKSRKLNPTGIGILAVFFLIALFIACRKGSRRN